MQIEQLKKIIDFLEKKEGKIPKEKGNLNLHSFKKLTSLPKGLKVGGILSLMFADIESLPEGLKVGGNLSLSESNIESLPEGLEVGGDLYIENTELEGYIDEEIREMIKPGFIKGKIVR